MFLLWCNTVTYQAAAGERDRERAVVMDTGQSGDEPLQRKSYHRQQQQRCGGCCCDVLCPLLAGVVSSLHFIRRILMENATFTKTGSAETKEHWALGHWVVSGWCTFCPEMSSSPWPSLLGVSTIFRSKNQHFWRRQPYYRCLNA